MLTGNLQVDALVQDVMGRAEWALIEALNAAARKVLEYAEVHVPKSEDHQPRPGDPAYPAKSLAESGTVVPAEPGNASAEVVFDSPYAAAQEAGHMNYRREDRQVDWVAENYTTPGTGRHYLEDALKSVIPELEPEVAAMSRVAFGEIPGVKPPKSTITTLGRREEVAPPPTGDIARVMQKEQFSIESAGETSFRVPPSPPITQ